MARAVAMVASGASMRVECGWWEEFWGSVDQPHVPIAVVHQPMMEAAEEDAVVNVGAASAAPRIVRVMRFAPTWRSLATREGASAIAFGQGPTLGATEEAS